MRTFTLHLILLTSLVSKAQNHGGFIYYNEVAPYIKYHKSGKKEIAKLVLKYEDTLKDLTNQIVLKSRTHQTKVDIDSTNAIIVKIEKFRSRALTRIKFLENQLDSLTSLEITRIHKRFLKENNLSNVGISYDIKSDDNFINYSNLFIEHLESK